MTASRSLRRGVSLTAALAAFAAPTAALESQQAPAASRAGLVTLASPAPFDTTLARLQRAITERGLTIAATIDHSAAARRARLELRPTTVVIAGNPAVGTPLMQAEQSIALDLPLRFLVWVGADGAARVSYEPIRVTAARHGLAGQEERLARMTAAMEAIARAATSR